MGSGGSKQEDSKKNDKHVRKICIPVDGSVASERAVRWAVTNLAQPSDKLCMATFVAHQSPFVGMDDIVQDDYEDAKLVDAKGLQEAEKICTRYTALIHDMHRGKETKIPDENVTCAVKRYMPSASTSSGVGPTIVEHSHTIQADVLVMGSRGLGAIQRSLLRTLGLGSASDYTVHNCEVPVVVVKPSPNDVKRSKK